MRLRLSLYERRARPSRSMRIACPGRLGLLSFPSRPTGKSGLHRYFTMPERLHSSRSSVTFNDRLARLICEEPTVDETAKRSPEQRGDPEHPELLQGQPTD